MNATLAKQALTMFLALGFSLVQGDQPLSIKGVVPGDTIDKMGQLADCSARGGFCAGYGPYGSVPNAGFVIGYAAGKITSIGVSFSSSRSKEVLAGLTERFGPPGPGECKPGIECHTWRSNGLKLNLVMDAGGNGGVSLSGVGPVGGF